MKLETILRIAGLMLFGGLLASAGILAECPAVGVDTGCGILMTITGASGGAATAFTVIAASNPTQGPYDGTEDTLVGVLNSSGVTVNTLTLSSTTDIFGFEGDGPCTVTPNPGNCNTLDPTGYAGPNVTFSGINAAHTSGTVYFMGGLASSGSRWFGLEKALTPSQISGTPEPGSMALLAAGLIALCLYTQRRAAA